ncbi:MULTISPECIES: hypothetical protein [Acidithiobacillus]|uniref:Uncharacterized protein n=1 Tax=Acidithiobacillus caldus (strain ATCC 51756 / DSM 8584 / KU) TaxID=637389 RepID=A0A059ZMX6_ACICK|nr:MULTISPECIES: hypothetical protein [Acidithiobacillus]AIA54359.1 hypothetical protein Acaty_c0471 [Acidithiobacillus caldus ATCC 51756]MBU2728996.1 hypothetical protein [Acidithiobacillus caldus]MBU2734771.1 hypothetical protein [Acidithiobacillus caldus ATCC 51756]MBU2744139.1 hypothetical protein [Acidithiobacillus caldus]MBU2762217.1 hypothetical protein [Acidithiobacillus caldus]
MSAIHLLSRLSRCHTSQSPGTPDLAEVLAAISERQSVLERQWQSIIQSLPEASPAEITSRLLALDEERARYRRFWTLLRANLRVTSKGASAPSDVREAASKRRAEEGSTRVDQSLR